MSLCIDLSSHDIAGATCTSAYSSGKHPDEPSILRACYSNFNIRPLRWLRHVLHLANTRILRSLFFFPSSREEAIWSSIDYVAAWDEILGKVDIARLRDWGPKYLPTNWFVLKDITVIHEQ